MAVAASQSDVDSEGLYKPPTTVGLLVDDIMLDSAVTPTPHTIPISERSGSSIVSPVGGDMPRRHFHAGAT